MHQYPTPPINMSISRPISPMYEGVLRREMETLFGTANHATASTLVYSVCFNYLCSVMCISHPYHMQNDFTSMTTDHGFGTEDVSIRVLMLMLCDHTIY